MTTTSQDSKLIIEKMFINSGKWYLGLELEKSIEILESHTELMIHYQELPTHDFTKKEIEQLQQLSSNIKELMSYLDVERKDLFEKISMMNDSEKIATQYIKQFSDSYFIDKDF